jgi:hypothetical protein
MERPQYFVAYTIFYVYFTMFSLSALINLNWFRLQTEKLDQILIMANNWPRDLHLNYTPNTNLKDYMKAKVVLAKEIYQLKKLNTLKRYKLVRIRWFI